MPTRTSPLLALSTLLLTLAPAVAVRADGVPAGPPPGEAQSRPEVRSDGRGGAIVSFKTVTLKLGAVHVDRDGVPDGGLRIDPAAVPFTIEPNEPLRVIVPSDSQVVFVADRALDAGPALTRWRDGGTTTGDFPVALPMPLRRPAIVPGLAGRTLLVAKNSDAVSFWTMRAAIIGADGGLEFAVELPSILQFFMVDAIAACSDGAGGLLAALPYYDSASTGSKDLAIFRLAADGSRPWGDTARSLVLAARDQTDVQVAPDGAGGMIMVWTDARAVARSTDIFAHHVNADGQRIPGWSFYGSPVCDASGPQSQPRITRDGLGGVWIVWLDQGQGPAGDVRYTHLLGNGVLAPGFTTAGRVLCDAVGAQGETALCGDGAGGFFAVWRDDRSGPSDLYVQHVSATGAVAAGWEPNGRALTIAAGVQDQPAIAAVSGGRAVIAWRDARGGEARIYSGAIDDPATADAPTLGARGLRLEGAAMRHGAPHVRVTLGEPGDAVLELLDVTGRSRARQPLTGPCTSRDLGLDSGDRIAPGLYFVRLRQFGAVVSARLTVLR